MRADVVDLRAKLADVERCGDIAATEARRQCEWKMQVQNEADELRVKLNSLVGPDGINYCSKIEAERDKALADLAVAKTTVVRKDETIAVLTKGMPLLQDLLKSDSPWNYQEITGESPDGVRFAITCQRHGRPSPHEKRMEAEAERDKARADLKEAKLDVIRAVAEWAGTHVGNYREMAAARADADAMAGLLRRTISAAVLIHCGASRALAEEIGSALAKHAGGK